MLYLIKISNIVVEAYFLQRDLLYTIQYSYFYFALFYKKLYKKKNSFYYSLISLTPLLNELTNSLNLSKLFASSFLSASY